MQINGLKLLDEIKNVCDFYYSGLFDKKKEQTSKKVEFIKKYIELYLYVQLHRDEIRNIIFIDSMCNAGIYEDGDLCSSMEVLSLFIQNANKFPRCNFYLIVNDKNLKRVACTEWLFYKIRTLCGDYVNIKFYKFNEDVNDFLTQFDELKDIGINKGKENAMILFVDPYNFRSVKFENIISFLNDRYCELFYNVFSSDFTRNKAKYANNGDVLGFPSKYDAEALIKNIRDRLKITKHIKYCFSYTFKTKKRNTLYHIVYATPNGKGLKKLKEAIVDVFHDNIEHVNKANNAQMSLFTAEIETTSNKQNYAIEAREKLCSYFCDKEVRYDEIEIYVLENTILSENDIIQLCLRPLINERKIEKLNIVGARNYKQDRYKFHKQY